MRVLLTDAWPSSRTEWLLRRALAFCNASASATRAPISHYANNNLVTAQLR